MVIGRWESPGHRRRSRHSRGRFCPSSVAHSIRRGRHPTRPRAIAIRGHCPIHKHLLLLKVVPPPKRDDCRMRRWAGVAVVVVVVVVAAAVASTPLYLVAIGNVPTCQTRRLVDR